jgi:hypothetical protein
MQRRSGAMRPRRVLGAWFVVVAALLSGGITASPAGAAGGAYAGARADDAEQALADRFAPVVRLVHQDVECGPGEPYQPSDVALVLGDQSVALRGPWAGDDMIRAGPTAEDLSEGLFGYHLDYPGNPLEAGCDYEGWARTTGAGSPPTTYAHVATQVAVDDRLALQYWFFYPFNDYTNKHEGDWEMIQLVFAAADATQALDQAPLEVGYSQHEGLEVARWDDPKLEIVDGSHPVVNAAAGSHANYYDSALYLGTSAEQGFGCDDTRGSPSFPASPQPHEPSSRGSPSRDVGANARSRSTTGRPARTRRRAGPTRSATRSSTAATSATRFPRAASSAPRPPTSSAAPSPVGQRSSASSPTIPGDCYWSWR